MGTKCPPHHLSGYCPSVCPINGPRGAPYGLEPSNPRFGSATLLRPSCRNHPCWYRNINLFSITYAFRPRLRDRLTLGRLTLPRNPWAYGERVFHSFYRYSSLHYLFQALHQSLRSGFTAVRTLLYQYAAPQGRVYSMASVLCLSPVGLSAQSRLTSELLRFL